MNSGGWREVGGIEALERLDDEPIPPEPFQWSHVADVDRDIVEPPWMRSSAVPKMPDIRTSRRGSASRGR